MRAQLFPALFARAIQIHRPTASQPGHDGAAYFYELEPGGSPPVAYSGYLFRTARLMLLTVGEVESDHPQDIQGPAPPYMSLAAVRAEDRGAGRRGPGFSRPRPAGRLAHHCSLSLSSRLRAVVKVSHC